MSCCRHFLAACGERVNIERGADFGQRVWLGDYSDIGIDCKFFGEVHIGKNSFMGPEVVVWAKNHRFDNLETPMMYQGYDKERPVVIGDDVWIGTRAILLPGVRVGNHAVVGAGAVVAKDVPDWAIVVGNPARVVRYRNQPKAAQDASAPLAVKE